MPSLIALFCNSFIFIIIKKCFYIRSFVSFALCSLLCTLLKLLLSNNRICPFLLGSSLYWHIVAYSLAWSLYFCGVSYIFPFFISNVIDLNLLPPLFWYSWLKVYLFFFNLFKELAFSFIDLLYWCLHLCLFISALIFMMSFLLLTLGFVYSSFSSCFQCKVGLFWDFSCLLR